MIEQYLCGDCQVVVVLEGSVVSSLFTPKKHYCDNAGVLMGCGGLCVCAVR